MWIAAFVLATVVLVGHFHHAGSLTPTEVVLATRPIPSGTPGSVIVSNVMYRVVRQPSVDVRSDRISDPQYLVGKAARYPILVGQQLGKSDFSAEQK
jgi:hypothetical protein